MQTHESMETTTALEESDPKGVWLATGIRNQK